jgi:hypothetical protein
LVYSKILKIKLIDRKRSEQGRTGCPAQSEYFHLGHSKQERIMARESRLSHLSRQPVTFGSSIRACCHFWQMSIASGLAQLHFLTIIQKDEQAVVKMNPIV